MLEKVKMALRIATEHFDDEITDLMEAARQDLILSGVSSDKASKDDDALITRAIKTYCKAYFGYDNPDADRFAKSYEMLKIHLSLSTEYRGDNSEA